FPYTTLFRSLFFLVSAILLTLLPEKEQIDKESIPPLTISQVVRDFTVVQKFMMNNKYVSFIYLGFIIVMIFLFVMDAQEVVFTHQVIGLLDMGYRLWFS